MRRKARPERGSSPFRMGWKTEGNGSPPSVPPEPNAGPLSGLDGLPSMEMLPKRWNNNVWLAFPYPVLVTIAFPAAGIPGRLVAPGLDSVSDRAAVLFPRRRSPTQAVVPSLRLPGSDGGGFSVPRLFWLVASGVAGLPDRAAVLRAVPRTGAFLRRKEGDAWRFQKPGTGGKSGRPSGWSPARRATISRPAGSEWAVRPCWIWAAASAVTPSTSPGRGFRVSAFDLSEEGTAHLRDWAGREGLDIDVKTADMRRLPYPDGAFDCVFAFHVISHTDTAGLRAVLSEIGRVLKKGRGGFPDPVFQGDLVVPGGRLSPAGRQHGGQDRRRAGGRRPACVCGAG